MIDFEYLQNTGYDHEFLFIEHKSELYRMLYFCQKNAYSSTSVNVSNGNRKDTYIIESKITQLCNLMENYNHICMEMGVEGAILTINYELSLKDIVLYYRQLVKGINYLLCIIG